MLLVQLNFSIHPMLEKKLIKYMRYSLGKMHQFPTRKYVFSFKDNQHLNTHTHTQYVYNGCVGYSGREELFWNYINTPIFISPIPIPPPLLVDYKDMYFVLFCGMPRDYTHSFIHLLSLLLIYPTPDSLLPPPPLRQQESTTPISPLTPHST